MSAEASSWEAKKVSPAAGEAVSTAALATAAARLHDLKPLVQMSLGHQKVRVVKSTHTLWAVFPGQGSSYLAARLCSELGSLRKVKKESADQEGLTVITAEGTAGSYQIELSVAEHEQPVLRCRNTLTPFRDLLLSPADRDLFALSKEAGQVGRGMVYATQKGCEAGYALFTVEGGGSFFYLQNFSGLHDYWEATGTEPKESVNAEWPELGFRLPTSSEKPLKGGKSYTLTDFFIVPSPEVPVNEYAVADLFLASLTSAYLEVPRPETAYYDWPGMTQKSLKALMTSRACQRRIKGKTYLNAYVGSDYKPPESMVQWALLVPLLEFAVWQEKKVPLADQMLKAVLTFHDQKAKSVARWLPGVPFKKEELSEEEHSDVIDSWYLVHIVHNLGRMVEMGQRQYSDLYFESVSFLMKAAAKFKHDWPVFYHFYTLKVLKQETEPGAGGEQDVPGLYVKVMIQAYELSRDQRYLKEAEAAAARLKDLGLKLLYQTNNTVMAATALAMLWKHTSNRLYLDTSRLCLANAASRFWLWELDVGCSRHYSTFMALPPLHNAPYASPYEEAEVCGSLCKYLEVVGPELTEPPRLLIAEYIKYLLHRGRFYYPEELPEGVISDKVREGIVDRELPIPLEDIYPVSEKAGQVGQEVYGAACPFILLTHAYVRLKSMPFLIFSEYPILQHSFREEKGEGVVVLHIGGSERLGSWLRCVGLEAGGDLSKLELRVYDAGPSPWEEAPVKEKAAGMWSYEISGNRRMAVSWKPKKKGKGKKQGG